MSLIVFTTRLTADDWDESMHGWRCQVLNVPGAIVEAVYVEGNRVDTARYEILAEHTFIRWMAPDKPQRVVASIKLTETLSLGTETERWKRLAIILPVVATVLAATISGAATYLSRTPVSHASNTSVQLPLSATSQGAQVPRVKLDGSTVDVIGDHNYDFSSALPVEFGSSYLARFGNDNSSRYFTFHQDGQSHYLNVQLTLTAPDAEVQPILSIYDVSHRKLFSRYHEKKDGSTTKWTVPISSGDYIVEVNPNGTTGSFDQFLLMLTAG